MLFTTCRRVVFPLTSYVREEREGNEFYGPGAHVSTEGVEDKTTYLYEASQKLYVIKKLFSVRTRSAGLLLSKCEAMICKSKAFKAPSRRFALGCL